MKTLPALAIVFSISTAATAARAETLEEQKYWKRQMANVGSTVKTAEKRCGTTFTIEFLDKARFRAEAEKTRHSPYSICENIVKEVLMLCNEGDDEKAAVKAKITGFRCGFANPRRLDLKGGLLVLESNHVEANFSAWAKPRLMKKL